MNRKTFLKTAALAGAAGIVMPKFSLGAGLGSDKIKVAFVGLGGRGTGALINMVDADENIEIVAVGELFPERVEAAKKKLSEHLGRKYKGNGQKKFAEIWKATGDTTFYGLDAIDKVLQTNADVVALVTPPCFRTPHIEKCLKAGKNVFAEKPVCVDATQLRKIYNELVPLADSKGLKILCGTQMRYHSAIQEAVNRVRDGQIGDIIAADFLRYESSYLHGWYDVPKNLKPDDVEYQIREWLAFRWTSGDQIVEQYVHNLDMALWAIGKLPVEVVGSGGRQIDIPYPERGDRFSNCHAQYEFDDGASLTAACRQEDNTSPYAPFKVFGTKGTLLMSFGKQRILGEKPWESDYQKKPELICEHEALFGAIRNGTPFNTLKTCADSCFVAIAGRESCYAGKRLKLAWVLEKSQQNMVPDNLKLTDKKPVEEVPVCGKYKLV